ncbi:gamma-glutamyltransferase [Candidatus Marinimicrobia bacterium]|mgnify:FL=1|nr:gamma-glutamyltransferase [Candidatus Neomarinimicrobiota bacterium]MDC1038416.1 gamma-glutamyltransferase [Candidatus Neomarinimicrobiota bacterium]
MKQIHILFATFIFSFQLLTAANSNPVFGKNGMIVSTSKQASEAGIQILKKGGNAVDAAVAVGFALAVTSSSNGNIGGGGFMVAAMANGETFTLDHREKAPAAAHRDLFLNDSGNVIPGMSLFSRVGSGVPGTVDGLIRALADHGSGKISLRQALAPAIRLSEKGFKISHYEARRFNGYEGFFERNEAAAAIFIRKDNKPWKKGDTLVQKDLAKTLKRIAKFGRDGFYSGPVANYIVEEMKRGNGLISHEDLENYSSVYRDPVKGIYKGHEIISMGPPSSGGALLINMMNMLENYAVDSLSWNSSDYIHLVTEVERRAYADRAEHMGDPDFWDVPLDMLTSKEYAQSRINDISLEKATPSSAVSASGAPGYESRETTHYSVVDQWGNAVSVTTTINLSYGSGHLVKGAGFFLNNEMDDFSSKPGVPNAFGLVGNEANSIQAGKRPLSSMTPTIVLKDGKPFMVIGSPGGSTIITTTMQAILNVIDYDMDIKEAVASPRFHSQWLPDVIMTEPRGLSKDVIQNLESKGHTLVPYKWGYIGEANGILISEDGFYGGGDSRGETSAIGY